MKHHPKLHLRYLPALLVATTCPIAIAAHAATKTIALKEQLNQKWTNELLSYPFTAAKGEAVADSIAVTGPAGPVPAQLTEVTFWPDTKFVKSARLVFVAASLEPTTTTSYTVTYGKTAVPRAASDLKVVPGEGSVEVTTAHVGARFLVGEKTYAAPVPAEEAPAPLQSFRPENGAWSNPSTLFGDLAVKSWTARVTEAGPVLARVAYRSVLSDDSVAEVTATIVTGDDKVLWEDNTGDDRPLQGVELQLGKVPGIKQIGVPKSWGQWGRERTIAPVATADPTAFLSPNTSLPNVFPEGGPVLVLAPDAGASLRLASRQPEVWVDPVKPFTYGGQEKWNLDMIPVSWENWKRKRVPIYYAADGETRMKVSFAKGRRAWSTGSGAGIVGERLNEVKDMALDWPTKPSAAPHPFVFLSKAELQDRWKKMKVDPQFVTTYINQSSMPSGAAVTAYLNSGGDKEVATKSKVVEQLRQQLGLLGDYDTMRYGIATVGLYDALIDTDLVTPAEKSVLRAQMAYLGYKMADPMMWSIERGYHSGNPNMSVSYTLTLGIIACAIPDHPMAKTWSDYCTRWMDKWLTDEVGTNGEWLPEGGHYSQVSMVPMVAYAVAAKRAGFHDFTTDPRLKKLALYFAKWWTPADPLRGNRRLSPPVGRGLAGDSNGFYGVLARATAQSDPAFSQTMQWMWQQTDYERDLGDWRLGGFERLYTDRDLPAKKPAWKSELFPNIGPVFRDAVGDPTEHYLNILANDDSLRNLDIWTPEVGNIASWFAYGKPLSKQFSHKVSYNERHELVRGGVTLARNWAPGDVKTPFGYYTTTTPQGFSALPRTDYVAATYRNTKVDDRDWFPEDLTVAWPKVKPATGTSLTWTRQVLYQKDDTATGPHYVILRDTTAGGQPTTWQFWTLSEKIGGADETKDATAFLADKPGNAILPARTLPAGQRYTALGQMGVDVDYFVAAPTDTPRSTMRYGGVYSGVSEYEDALHLQNPGDGTYFVALFPRQRGEAAPAFSTLGEGKVIKVVGAFGTDYGFLSPAAATVTADDASFEGTAGSVQDRKGVAVLSLSAAGKVTYKGTTLSSPGAASLRVEGKTAAVEVSGATTQVTFGLPGTWRLAQKAAGVALKADGKGGYLLTVPAGSGAVQLVSG